MADDRIDQLNDQIKRAGADWVARETPYSHIRAGEDPGSFLGLALTPEDALVELQRQREEDQLIQFSAAPPPPPPPRIDWRSHDGRNWVTPVKNQGHCGSCVAFATCGAIESRLLIQANQPNAGVDLSEAHLFYCGAPDSCSTGWQPSKAMEFAIHKGIGKESDFPYKPGDQACRMIPPVVRLNTYRSVAISIERKRALTAGPVVAAMAVFEDFFSYGSGIYRHVSGNLSGYHAICLVGYDDAQACWIAKNSWGTNWGDRGFFRIRYGECGLDTQFQFTVPGTVIVPQGVTPFE